MISSKKNIDDLKYDLVLIKLKKYLEFYKSVYSEKLYADKTMYELKNDRNTDKLPISKDEVKISNSKKLPVVNDLQNIVECSSMNELKKLVENCTECDLSKSRINTVFGSGSGKSGLVIIGEAPGAEEDKTGKPFVGRAGQLLTKMLSAIDIDREDVFICNVLKCRPPNNRDPKTEEIIKCSAYLDKQLEFLKPKYILALGRIAAKRLLNKDITMKEFRKDIHSYKNIPVMVTYHPSALLRNPKWKYDAWDDLKNLRVNLDK